MTKHIRTESAAPYGNKVPQQSIIIDALNLLAEQLQSEDLYPTINAFTDPDITCSYLTLTLASEKREHFHALFLNNQHKLILDSRMFSGTIDGASVYPREVVKLALEVNAAAVIFAHNHPSGICEPSEADKKITARLKQGLDLFDIRVLDHIIVGHMQTYSFSEHGLI